MAPSRSVLGALKVASLVLAGLVVAAAVMYVLWPKGEASLGDASMSAVAAGLGEEVPTTVSSSTSISTTTTEPPVEITIAAVGDVMGVQTVRWAAYDADTKTYDFYPMFEPMVPYIEGADYAVANLETRLADPDPDGGYVGLRRLNSPQALGEALEKAGFDLMALANNHSLDMGFDGIVQTLDRLDTIGLAHIGCYRSLEEKEQSEPFIVDIKGVKVAFLNYTDVNNGLYLASQHKAYAVNFLGADAAAAEARAAREAGADVVVLIIHWGKERQTKQNAYQTRVAAGSGDYQGLLQRGVDVILGSHPHVVQPAARVTYQTDSGPQDRYVVYSMGNFLPPSSAGWPEDSGLVAYVHILKDGEATTVTGISFLPVVRQRVPTNPETIRLLPTLPGLTPDTDTEIGETTQGRMDKAWNYYQAMYDKPEDNIVPLEPEHLSTIED